MKKFLKNILLKPMNMVYNVAPRTTLKVIFYLKNGYKLNLENPKTYNEKLNWMKLYYRNELMPLCADKYRVRQYVKDCGGEHLLNELYWNGYNAQEIPFDDLPQQFVIKVTHGSGFNIICRNKDKLDRKKTIETVNKWLNSKYIPCYGEWFYGIVKPRIIIEKFLNDGENFVPVDYKVFCFHGEPKYIVVDTDRYNGHKKNVYDCQWNYMEGHKMGFPNDKPIKRPECLEELLKEARKLAGDFPHVRIDFYIVNNKIYFGEITFTNGAGFDKIYPYSFDVELGSYIKL